MKYGRLLLVGALLFQLLIGGTDVSHYVTLLGATSAVIGALLIAFYIMKAPVEHDTVDLLVLGALGCFVLACVFSSIPRNSFESATTAFAYTAEFYLVRRVVADPVGSRLATTVLGLVGCLISVLFLLIWGAVWVRWIQITGAAPPLDLRLPPAPFRHHYLVGMLAALLVPATLQLARRPAIWPVGALGTAAALAVAFMSGSRSVWLGGLLAVCVTALSLRRKLPSLPRRIIPIALIATIPLALVSGSIVSRLVSGSTVTQRLGFWATSIEAWLKSPATGFGPGTFASELPQTGYYATQQGLIPHGHNAGIQLLVEGGALGIAVIALLGAALVIGLRRGGTNRLAPIVALSFFLGANLTDNATIVPFLAAPSIVWAAMALPAHNRVLRRASAWTRPLAFGLAAVVGIACSLALLAAWSYEGAATAASTGDSQTVLARLKVAASLDPSNALYRRDLAVWYFAAGQLDSAEKASLSAGRLNPGDATVWRAAAIIHEGQGKSAAAMADAAQAIQLHGADPLNQLTLAYLAQATGEQQTELNALARAIQRAPWITATSEWQGQFSSQTEDAIAAAANLSQQPGTDALAIAWLRGMSDRPWPLSVDPLEGAAASVIRCDTGRASAYLQQLHGIQAMNGDALLVRILVARATRAPTDELLGLARLTFPALAVWAERDVGGLSPLSGTNEDPWMYGRLSIPAPNAAPTLPISETGLSAWLRDPITAARAGAPDSRLASCDVSS